MSTHLNDLSNATVIGTAVAPVVISATTNGPAVDLAAADGPCFAVQMVGDVSDDGSVTGVMQQSADGTTWAAISGGAFAEAEAAGTQTIQFTRAARYVRWSGTLAGPSPSAAVAVLLVQEKKLF